MRKLAALGIVFFCLVSVSLPAEEPAHAAQPHLRNGDPLKAAVRPRATWGPADAPITIIEYGSFQCPDTRDGAKVLEDLLAKYPGKIQVVFKHRPIAKLPLSEPAAARYEALSLQSRAAARRFHDYVFANQARMRTQGLAFLNEAVTEATSNLHNFNREKFSADLISDEVKTRIETDDLEYQRQRFESGIPGFTVNGHAILRAPYDLAAFEKAIAKAESESESESEKK